MVTLDAHEAMVGGNHLGCISRCWVAPCLSSLFSAPRDDMLTMLTCATLWLYVHLYTFAYMSMHESCLLMCWPYFNTMKLWTPNPNLHLSLADTTFCLLSCLFAYSHICSHPGCYDCHIYLACSLCILLLLSTHFPSIACLLVSLSLPL